MDSQSPCSVVQLPVTAAPGYLLTTPGLVGHCTLMHINRHIINSKKNLHPHEAYMVGGGRKIGEGN